MSASALALSEPHILITVIPVSEDVPLIATWKNGFEAKSVIRDIVSVLLLENC